jgi:hypothetical protein
MNRLAKPADGSDDYRFGVDEAANRSFVEYTKFDLDVRSAACEFYALPSDCLTVAITLSWLESKFPLEFLQRSGSAERSHANDTAVASNVTLPPEGLVESDGGLAESFTHLSLGVRMFTRSLRES